MTIIPDVSRLALDDPDPEMHQTEIPDDINNTTDRYMQKLELYAKSIPYAIESSAQMQDMLDIILRRITQCVEAKDFEPGLVQWDSMVTYWNMLKYPFPKEKRIRLAKLYFHVATTPGMPTQVMAICADGLSNLTRSKKKLSIDDMRLPWKPIYDILRKDLFLTRRQFEYSQLSWCMGYIADMSRRFFHPAAIEEMLSTFLPGINGTNLDSLLSSQYYLLTFLPLTHPQSYLPMLCRLWESVNSYMYDERMLQFLSRLAEMHVDPTISDPARIYDIPDDEKSEDEGRPKWKQDDYHAGQTWSGLYKDVGIFTEHEWHFIMCKCLASMEIQLKDAGSLTTGPHADTSSSFEIGRLPKANWRIPSLAKLIVYSIAPDGAKAPASTAPTPWYTPVPSGVSTPQVSGSTGDYLTVPLHQWEPPKLYLGGSKALDSLARLIASTEHFFHPTNSGSWTSDLTAFVKYIVYEFNKRWHEEQLPDCKTPMTRRLTQEMKRELVKCLRTVVLLAIFSQDNSTVSNVQSALKSMSCMEPDLVFQPILERAIPSLEALVETQRTLSVIKALSSIVPAIVSRDIYYPGAKHLITILQLLIPGIDLNDPTKTLCTTAFLSEVSQYIMFGDVTSSDGSEASGVEITPDDSPEDAMELKLPNEVEDALLKDSTASFASWVASFIRRVIQLLENLPEEGVNGSAGGTTEVQVVDAVTGACSQICVHLSNSLFDLVLNMIFDYASTNVRSNAVRAIHQLVECVANAHPAKTLAKFLPFCAANIRTEIEHGASSVRTTSSSLPLPSDATLHWNLAILRGCVYNDGSALLKYKGELLSLLTLLRDKTFSKRGYTWSGKLLSSALITLTHTYPIDNKFVNPEQWNDEDFQRNHHLYWGKLFEPHEVKITWHVPSAEEIDFALQLFRELVEPAMTRLDLLLETSSRDAIWRNDFCRYLSFVQEAFTGIPTLFKETISPDVMQSMLTTSDIINEIPEMIASVQPLASGFCLTDPQDTRYKYITGLRRRFGEFLHAASLSLQQQGEENTVDAVQMLIGSIRTYLLEYGDSKDSYSVNYDQYNSEINVARQYSGQKVWPRAVLVRRARFYHSSRLYWNSIERARGPLENSLLDDVVEWSMWHYPSVRQSSQSLLESLTSVYDGLRLRVLPALYKALQPGTDDDRMKGALWTLNIASFGRFAISEPTLVSEMIQQLLGCHHNEKPSIQNCVSAVTDTCLGSFSEPCYLIYDIENTALNEALLALKRCLSFNKTEDSITLRAREKRIERVRLMNEEYGRTTRAVLEVANDTTTHWRYAIVAVRILRTLLRRDAPTSPAHLRIFLEQACDSNPTMRYYAQRGIMKALRYIKLRSYCRDPAALALFSPINPLRCNIPIKGSYSPTAEILANFRSQVPIRSSETLDLNSIYCDTLLQGWLAWSGTLTTHKPPHGLKSTFEWESSSAEAVSCLREVTVNADFWQNLSGHFAEENHETVVVQDHISCVKSIFQVLGDKPWDLLKPELEILLADQEKNKQRAAAELLAGVLNGSKHWPQEAQDRIWQWFTPYIKKTLGQSMTTETVPIWTSFVEYMFYHKDPRRLQPLVEHIVEQFNSMDYNGPSSLESIKVLALFRAFYTELEWKFTPWSDSTLERFWREVHSEHDDVRSHVAELMAFCNGIKWQPKPSSLDVESFVRECRELTDDVDIMGISGTYHTSRVLELVENFKIWREQRLPGVIAHQSTYDRVGIVVCRWLFQSVHSTDAISAFDYILPLMPELFRFTEVHDNEELARRANVLLVRMCGVVPPQSMIGPLLSTIFSAIQKSPSWKVRLKALPILQVLYFRQLPLISESEVNGILDILCQCLDDEVVEVREMVGTTLSGILRLSPRRSVVSLKDRFVKLAGKIQLPDRDSPVYNIAIRQRHAAIIGICALIDSFPYTIEKWMPGLLTTVMLEHAHDPIPISTTIHRCASNFRKTHQDTWHEDSRRFTDDQLAALSTLLTGSSYYA
ncbi:uncharacterized protein EDB91DRAFT_1096855 [Suillus paluster]|uniref:uncharacterized protein n=1 Tax=Suillus paluster TaxID=48578 RepID=UPI001B8623FC|nr:uncharacterized protein EDB91DRAFT_1096855 [Suillus paluster]KAG1755021.1 hypothetical protein EDB91DRAFT_1096855 [Suillus paluster]